MQMQRGRGNKGKASGIQEDKEVWMVELCFVSLNHNGNSRHTYLLGIAAEELVQKLW